MKVNREDFEKLSKPEKKKVVQLFLKSSLYHFTHFLGYLDVNVRTHGEMITCLESHHQRKLVTVPRGSFKSSVCSISYPMWKLLRNPNERILLDTEVFGNSVLYLRVIKEHFMSPEFKEVFGDLEGAIWREDSIVLNSRTKKYKEASITCGGITTTRVGMHYETIIGDDYNSPANSDTREKAQKVVNHFKYNLNILEPSGEYVIIGTRYSEEDLIGFVLRDILGQKELSEGKLDIGLIA